MDKNFYSVEYLDGDGDPVIEHGFMTDDEARDLIEEFRSRGVTASVNRLSGHHGVSSGHAEELPGLERPDQRVVR